jgi:hypothetical protein
MCSPAPPGTKFPCPSEPSDLGREGSAGAHPAQVVSRHREQNVPPVWGDPKCLNLLYCNSGGPGIRTEGISPGGLEFRAPVPVTFRLGWLVQVPVGYGRLLLGGDGPLGLRRLLLIARRGEDRYAWRGRSCRRGRMYASGVDSAHGRPSARARRHPDGTPRGTIPEWCGRGARGPDDGGGPGEPGKGPGDMASGAYRARRRCGFPPRHCSWNGTRRPRPGFRWRSVSSGALISMNGIIRRASPRWRASLETRRTGSGLD